MKAAAEPLFVADASIALAWVLPQQASEATDSLLKAVGDGRRFTVPALWGFEVANALLSLARRRKIDAEHHHSALARLGRLRPVVDEESFRNAFTITTELAASYALSVYDAAYLEIALRRGTGLATRDDALRAAALKHGVRLI